MRSPRQRCLAPRATSANMGSLTSAIGGVGEVADISVTCESGRKGVPSAQQCRAIKPCNSTSSEVSMAHTLARVIARIVHESGSFDLTLTPVRLIQSGPVRRLCTPPHRKHSQARKLAYPFAHESSHGQMDKTIHSLCGPAELGLSIGGAMACSDACARWNLGLGGPR